MNSGRERCRPQNHDEANIWAPFGNQPPPSTALTAGGGTVASAALARASGVRKSVGTPCGGGAVAGTRFEMCGNNM